MQTNRCRIGGIADNGDQLLSARRFAILNHLGEQSPTDAPAL
jgi:hypothetical protein